MRTLMRCQVCGALRDLVDVYIDRASQHITRRGPNARVNDDSLCQAYNWAPALPHQQAVYILTGSIQRMWDEGWEDLDAHVG